MRFRRFLWHLYEPVANAVGFSPLAKVPLVGAALARLGYLSRRYAFTPLSNTATVHGFKMKLGRFSHHNTPLFANEAYEPGTCHILRETLKPGMTAVDAGANIGFYTLMASRLVGPQGKVFSFEASPENFAVLQDNIKLNSCSNVIAMNKAITNREGVLKLWVSQENPASHSLFPDYESSGSAVEVEAVSLDTLFENLGWPPVDLIKLDIEGAEPLAIEGMGKLISRMKKLNLIVELNPLALKAAGVSPQVFLRQLQQVGFTISVVRDPEGLLEPLNDSSLLKEVGETGIVNLLCVKR